MISVMSDREIGSKISPSSSSSTGADLSLLESEPIEAEYPDPKADVGVYRSDPWRSSSSENGDRRRTEMESEPQVESGRQWMNGFEAGDMVWGKVKSHPWWPGHIYNESFASPSVRRLRRDGHVLVAFFGDSSYGWFDPAELIPFEPNFLDKSRQTSARTFIKAVEESADEAGRRGALALACRCRNPDNFRPTSVPGYVFVDLPGYEPGGVYSFDQIRRARDRFVPADLLRFACQLAAGPARTGADRDVHWIQSMAKLRAYRQVVFEEFDETYAQAFGVQPVRPTPEQKLEQQEKFASRATPLSGPLVIAEALGDKKPVARTIKPATALASASTSVKKNNKYVLKRREESPAAAPHPRPSLPDLHHPHHHGVHYLPQRPTAAADGDYVLQKRAVEQDQLGILSSPGAAGSSENSSSKAEPDVTVTAMDVQPDVDRMVIMRPLDTGAPMDFTQQQTRRAEDMKVADGVVRKVKPLKRKPEDGTSGSDASDLKKRKKKKMKELDMEGGQTHIHKIDVIKKAVAKHAVVLPGQAVRMGAELQSGHIPPAPLPTVELASLNLQFPDLLTNLSALALDPFFGAEHNVPSICRQAFLKFRSLVYQKSLVLPPASEPETAEFRASKLAAGKSLLQQPASTMKPFKRPMKPDDPSIAGRKRSPSDRQEEMSAKRVKKLEKVKALAAEKKAVVPPKSAETMQREQRETSAAPSVKPNRTEPPVSKKQEPQPPAKVPSPTWFLMKFPPRTTLPSVASLKARFARFGPLDLDGTRVYWKSYTCKVLFKYRVDAVSAYSYVKSNDLFGQIKVNYSIREVDAPAQEASDSQKAPDLSRANDGLQTRPVNGSGASHSMSQAKPLPPPLYQRQQSVQLKSCLKKPADEVANPVGSIPKESPRVKFMLGGASDGKVPPLVALANNNVSVGGSVGMDADGSSFPPLMDSSSIGRNGKSLSFVPPPQSLTRPALPNPPLMSEMYRLPPPPPLPRNLEGNQSRGPVQFSEPQPSPRLDQTDGKQVDISRQMLSLMMRCNDIVTNIKSTLGYVPYHPL